MFDFTIMTKVEQDLYTIITMLVKKILLFLKNSCKISLPCFIRKLTITEELILTIFTYKWGKCVKPMGKWLLESLMK